MPLGGTKDEHFFCFQSSFQLGLKIILYGLALFLKSMKFATNFQYLLCKWLKYKLFRYSKKLAKKALEVYKVISWTSCTTPAESQMQQILALITSDQTMTFKTCLRCAMCFFEKKCQKRHFIFKLLNCLFVFKYCKVQWQVLVHLV